MHGQYWANANCIYPFIHLTPLSSVMSYSLWILFLFQVLCLYFPHPYTHYMLYVLLSHATGATGAVSIKYLRTVFTLAMLIANLPFCNCIIACIGSDVCINLWSDMWCIHQVFTIAVLTDGRMDARTHGRIVTPLFFSTVSIFVRRAMSVPIHQCTVSVPSSVLQSSTLELTWIWINDSTFALRVLTQT